MNNPFFNKRYGVKSKNVGPFLAFGKEWFEKHQGLLLFLLNFPVIKIWFRWVLRIHRDCKLSELIVQIQPNNYKILLPDGNIKADFRTHPKFSKRVYFAFRWHWWILHYLDELFSASWLPELNFGFDTLTAYPAASTSGGSTDATIFNVRTSGETFSTISARTTGSSTSSTGATAYSFRVEAHTTTNYFDGLTRSIFTFDTSSIADDRVIIEVSFAIYFTSKASGLGTCDVNVVGTTPADIDSIVNADYGQFGTTSYGAWTYAGVTISTYNDLVLNSSGEANISKTGVSCFGVLSSWDFNKTFGGTWASNATTGMVAYFADDTGTTRDPRLLVTHVSASAVKTVNGLAIASVKTGLGLAIASIKTWNGLT